MVGISEKKTEENHGGSFKTVKFLEEYQVKVKKKSL